MFKGLIIKNSDTAEYLENSTKPYELRKTFSGQSLSDKTIRYEIKNTSLSEEEIRNYFKVGQSLSYHNTVMFSPLEPGEMRGMSTDGLPTYEFYDQFNYNSIEYRDFISNLSEIELPNFYLSRGGGPGGDNESYNSIFAFGTYITNRDIFTNRYALENNYNSREPSELNRLQNIFLEKYAYRYGKSYKDLFPFAVDIKLNFKDIDIMSTMLDDHGLHKSSLSIIDSIPKENVSFNVINKNFENEETSVIDIPVSSVEDLINYSYFPREGGLVYLPDKKVRSRFVTNLDKLRLNREYNKIKLDHLPSFQNISNGGSVKNEILYVKIQKFSGEDATGELIQNIWLRDASKVDMLDPSKSKYGIYDYFDTQVKVGNTYTYVIKAYVLIYGAEIQCETYNEFNKVLTFKMKPSYKITEVELSRKTITVLPPIQLPPIVRPHYDEIKNKIYFYLSLQDGRKFMDYNTFRIQDEIYRQKIYDTSQYNKPEHAFLEESAIFEVFRMEEEPQDLVDFSAYKIAEVSREGFSITALFSQNVSYNKEYYYLFRTLNSLNYPSNPTLVHKVKLVKGIEKNRLEVEIYEINPPPEEFDHQKNFTKLIHIMPNIRDSFIDSEKTSELNSYVENINEVKIGLNENFSLWGKKYKIRIKSNNTGKKIDINVRFKLTREQ
tara:strand:+ start:515 stop:2506 length:1992 start_codon:yes stop_codon:yes gene_type:complete